MVLDAARLRSALIGIFEKRRQHVLPDRLPPPPPELAVPYRKLPKELASTRIYAAPMSKPQRFSIQYSRVARMANGIRRRFRGRDRPRNLATGAQRIRAAAQHSFGMKATFRSSVRNTQAPPNHCAQFCALCARNCALSRCQPILLDSAESHPPVIEKPLLRQGFSCYRPLPNDPQTHRRYLTGTQLTSRGSQVRNLHRPPIESVLRDSGICRNRLVSVSAGVRIPGDTRLLVTSQAKAFAPTSGRRVRVRKHPHPLAYSVSCCCLNCSI
jgi:hypothetical protein